MDTDFYCSGFYVDKDIPNWGHTGHPKICLVTRVYRQNTGDLELYRVRRPNNQWLRLELTRREVSAASPLMPSCLGSCILQKDSR